MLRMIMIWFGGKVGAWPTLAHLTNKADDKRKSITCMHRKKHGCTTDMIAMRKLNAGRLRHMNQNRIRNINGKSWGLMTHEQKRSIT